MKNLKVNEEACIGCGACVAIDPSHFEFNDNGLSEVINNENIENDEVINAVEACPTGAIVIIENDCNCQNGGECTCEVCECDNCNCENDNECNCECCDCECDHN